MGINILDNLMGYDNPPSGVVGINLSNTRLCSVNSIHETNNKYQLRELDQVLIHHISYYCAYKTPIDTLTLDLSKNGIDDIAISYWLVGTPEKVCIDRKFYYNNHPLTKSGIVLTKVNLSNNKIGDEGARSIAKHLKDGNLPKLKELHLEGNGITKSGAVDLLAALDASILDEATIVLERGELIRDMTLAGFEKTWNYIKDTMKYYKNNVHQNVELETRCVETEQFCATKRVAKNVSSIVTGATVECVTPSLPSEKENIVISIIKKGITVLVPGSVITKTGICVAANSALPLAAQTPDIWLAIGENYNAFCDYISSINWDNDPIGTLGEIYDAHPYLQH